MAGGRRTRPRGRPYHFACRVCRIVLRDGVDYTWCPRCGNEVDWIDARYRVLTCARCDLLVNKRLVPDDACPNCEETLALITGPLPAEPPPLAALSPAKIAGRIGVVLLVVQAVLAALDPHAFPYLVPLLVVLQLFAFLIVGWFVVTSTELHAIAGYHQTRVIHGLEHATANVLEERDFKILRGQTDHGMFTLDLEHDGTSYEHLEATVRDAAQDAISRIRFGEHSLAYDPRCGTSLLVGIAMLAVAITGVGLAALIIGMPVGYTFALTVVAGLAARLLSRPAGLAAQRWLTVSTRFASAVVTRVDKRVSADGSTLTAIVMIDVIPKPREGDVDAVAPVPL